MIPVLVCVPSNGGIQNKNEGLPITIYRSEPIGMLRGFEAAALTDDRMVEAELRALGLVPRYHARCVKADNGCVGALVSFAVEVQTYEDAQKLPGFEPFGDWSGAFYPLPTNINDIIERLADKSWEHTIQRVEVGNDFIPPPYDAAGTYALSFLPYGRLGYVYFFRKDPRYCYVSVGGFIDNMDNDERVASVKRFMEEPHA